MREQFASIVSPLHALHAFILTFMVFIFGNYWRELVPLRRQARFAGAVHCALLISSCYSVAFLLFEIASHDLHQVVSNEVLKLKSSKS
jgi:hypothetical protein